MRAALKNFAHSIVLGVALITGQGLAHDGHAVPLPQASKSGAQIQAAGLAFWNTLSEAQRTTLSFAFNGPEAKAYWTSSQSDGSETLGVRVSELGPDQRRRLDDLLIASTSSQGYFKIQAAMQGDARSDEHRISVFGHPQTDRYWSFSLNGPHLRYNVMVLDGHMILMPVLYGIGTRDHDGLRLPQEFSRGYELLRSLTPDQRRAAIVASNWQSAERSSETASVFEGTPDRLEHKGVSGDQLRLDQRNLMWKLIVEYVGNSDFDFAADHFERIHSGGWQNLHFLWIGPSDGSGPVFYRVSGPSILIEFAAVRTQTGEVIHPHVLMRDPNNTHGANWLTQHVTNHH